MGVMDTDIGIEKSKRLPKLKTKKAMDVAFENVSFSYDDGEQVLNNISSLLWQERLQHWLGRQAEERQRSSI